MELKTAHPGPLWNDCQVRLTGGQERTWAEASMSGLELTPDMLSIAIPQVSGTVVNRDVLVSCQELRDPVNDSDPGHGAGGPVLPLPSWPLRWSLNFSGMC